MDRLYHILAYPEPYRARFFRVLIKRFRLGSYGRRLEIEAVHRPWYGWCVYHAALEAKRLGHNAISVVEMGVAGGNGLLCLSDHAEQVARTTGVGVAVYGFDAGQGLPMTGDTRDLLYCWPAGSFKMDFSRLSERLGDRATLIIGDVRQTVPRFQPAVSAPLGAVMFDLDLYTSTIAALDILDSANRLPRVWCWFDDIIGGADNLYCERNGERAAINDYNQARNECALLSPANCSFEQLAPRYWHQQMYIDHRFSHPEYNHCLSAAPHELPLT